MYTALHAVGSREGAGKGGARGDCLHDTLQIVELAAARNQRNARALRDIIQVLTRHARCAGRW